ncbi:MAG: DegV family protein [Lachnospiraceae bacterium]
MSFRIFVDSGANIPAVEVEKYNIDVISFVITVDDKEIVCYHEGKSPEEEMQDGKNYYDAIRNGAEAKTSLINSFQFAEEFEKALVAGEDVLCINLSSNISGTFNAAMNAASELREQYPDRKIEVIDSKNASLGQGLLAVYASIMRSEGKDFDTVVDTIKSYVPRINGVFTVGDLKYLAKTGRVHKATAMVGNMLNIKPILRGDMDGYIVEYKKVRGRRKSLEELVNLIANNIENPEEQIVGIAHADAYTETCDVVKKIRERTGVKDVMITSYDFCTGSHVGPDTIAIFFLAKDRELAGAAVKKAECA